ncbi:MAG: hypothetical protein GX815_07555, partial [Clostridiales bacterium]|nr:hypothetical protein [Clostridiales bacterium]
MNGIFITSGGQTAIEKAYDQSVRSALADKINFLDYISDPETMEERKEDLKNVHFIFSTWGMFPLNKDQIQKYFPNLKAVFYA